MGSEHHPQTTPAAPDKAPPERAESATSPSNAVLTAGAGSPAPLTALPNGLPRQTAILRRQRTHGNAFVGRVLREQPGGPRVQRHPEGFTPSIDEAEAVAEIENSPEAASGGGGVATAAAAPPAGEDEATAAATQETASEDQTEAAPAAETGPETAPAAAPDPTPAPAPATPTAMDLTKACEVLKKSYGTVKTIVPGSIVLLADRDATWAKYDEVTKGRTNPFTKQPWKDGDAKNAYPGLDGFADKGTVYVNQKTRLATATAHEMLHNNTAAGFRAAVGETINEGSTEYLAIKALKAASISIASGTAYPGEVGFVTKFIGVVGEDTLIKAYFGGAATLTDAFDAKQGKGQFAVMKPLADAKNYADAEKLLKPPAPAPKAL